MNKPKAKHSKRYAKAEAKKPIGKLANLETAYNSNTCSSGSCNGSILQKSSCIPVIVIKIKIHDFDNHNRNAEQQFTVEY